MTAPAQVPQSGSDFLEVGTRLFGPLVISAEAAIHFPDGLLGFAGDQRFVLLPAAAEGLYWLQSLEDGQLVFLVIDPGLHFTDYEVEVPADMQTAPGVSADRFGLLVIVTLPGEERSTATANLQGPIVVDFAGRCGRQLLLTTPEVSTSHPFDLQLMVGMA